MESVDMKKLETAIIYLKRIADGNNPINNLPVDEDSVLNNPNVVRCMFFVKEILEEVKRNNGCIGKKAKKRPKSDFPIEALKKFSYIEDKTISRFIEQINEPIDKDTFKQLNYKTVTKWLKQNDFLKEEYSQEFQKNVTLSTEKGIQLGIYSEKRFNSQGIGYLRVIYNQQAQEYIVQNMESVLSVQESEKDGQDAKNY